MIFSIREKNQHVIIDLGGRIDAETAFALRQTIREMTGMGKLRFVINFHQTTHVDGVAFGFFISTIKELRRLSGELILTNLKPEVHRLLEISLLDRFFSLGNLKNGTNEFSIQEATA